MTQIWSKCFYSSMGMCSSPLYDAASAFIYKWLKVSFIRNIKQDSQVLHLNTTRNATSLELKIFHRE